MFGHPGLHGKLDHILLVGLQVLHAVGEPHEDGIGEEHLPQQEGADPGLLLHDGPPFGLGGGSVLFPDGGDLLQHSVAFDEGLGIAPFVLVLDHVPGMGPEEEIVNVRGVATDQGSGQTEDISASGDQGAEGVSLAGLVLELVDLVHDEEVKEPLHPGLDELGGDGLAVVLLGDVGLPELLLAGSRCLVMPILFRVVTPLPDAVRAGVALLVTSLCVPFEDREGAAVFVQKLLAALRAKMPPPSGDNRRSPEIPRLGPFPAHDVELQVGRYGLASQVLELSDGVLPVQVVDLDGGEAAADLVDPFGNQVRRADHQDTADSGLPM